MRRTTLALAVLAALAAPACTSVGRAPELAHHTPAVSPAEKAYAAGAVCLREGNYERALDLFGQSWKESPDNPVVARDFALAVEGLKKSGDEAARQDLAEEAGKRWTAALRNLGHPAAKGKTFSFSRAELKTSIDHLSTTLMEKGLKEYRMGNLEAAIGIWRSIVAYDPGNAEAAKAIRTASTQLENLKKLAPPAK